MANFTKLVGAAAVAALLSATPALAQEWAEWDTDADGALTLEEFQAGFAARVDMTEWDADGDGLLNEEEFAGGIHDRYDLDDTEAFEEAEFAGIEEDFGEDGFWDADAVEDVQVVDSEGAEAEVLEEEPEVFALEAWDIDGDGVILREEFDEGFAGWGAFATFDADADGAVSMEEFTAEIFARYDDDATGIIEEPELTDIGDDMGDGGFWDA